LSQIAIEYDRAWREPGKGDSDMLAVSPAPPGRRRPTVSGACWPAGIVVRSIKSAKGAVEMDDDSSKLEAEASDDQVKAGFGDDKPDDEETRLEKTSARDAEERGWGDDKP
jgi:hypothetical protein